MRQLNVDKMNKHQMVYEILNEKNLGFPEYGRQSEKLLKMSEEELIEHMFYNSKTFNVISNGGKYEDLIVSLIEKNLNI